MSTPHRLLSCLAPPAKFGQSQARLLDRLEAPAGRLTGHPTPARQPILRVLLDDPAAVVLSLRNHMQPVDLIELILIVDRAAVDALGDRRRLRVATRSRPYADTESFGEFSRSPQPNVRQCEVWGSLAILEACGMAELALPRLLDECVDCGSVRTRRGARVPRVASFRWGDWGHG